MKSTVSIFLMGASSLFVSPCFALETKPWFGDQYTFNVEGIVAYSRFNKVAGASKQLSSAVNSRDLLLDLGFTPSAVFDLQLEAEFGKTTQVNWALRSGAFQARYQLLDDISGDPVSLALGLIVRGAPNHFLKDVSTPYAAECNTELTCAIGREWSEEGDWTMRLYGLAALGQANRGYPWTREQVVWQYNLYDTHRFTLFAEGEVGFGNKQHVNVEHFRGWGKFQHQSIDLGGSYGYQLGLYGVLTASYAHRVFAHNFPEHVDFFMLSYCLSFSLF